MKSQKLKIKPIKKDLVRLKENQVSTLCVAIGREVVGLIGYSDGTRPEAAGMVEKLRANEALSAKDKQIHDAGLVSVLRQLHDDLDAAVFAAYGWPTTLTDAEILERLVALNAERAKEEASGLVRWLRPDYQNPGSSQAQQTTLEVEVEPATKARKQRAGKLAWPKTLSERVKAVSTALATLKEPVTAPEMARRFARARPADVREILETLCAMGKARHGKGAGTFLP